MAAYHEAGHTVAGTVLGATLDFVTIVPMKVNGKLADGYCCWKDQPETGTWNDWFLDIVRLKAGQVAQALACRVTWLDYGSGSDDAGAREVAEFLHQHTDDSHTRSEQVKATLTSATQMARSILRSPYGRAAVRLLAEALVEQGTMQGREATLLLLAEPRDHFKYDYRKEE